MDIRRNLTSHLSSVVEDVGVCIEVLEGTSMSPTGVTSMYAPFTSTTVRLGWEAGTRVETPWSTKSPEDIKSERRGLGILFISRGGGIGQQPSGLNGRTRLGSNRKGCQRTEVPNPPRGGTGVKGTGISQSLPRSGSIGPWISR